MNIQQGKLFNKKKQKINKEGFELMDKMNEYSDDTDELLKDYSDAFNRTNQDNPLKNKNIKIELQQPNSESINEFGYVNNVGILRPYMDNVDYRSTTWGKNGCPTYLSTTNVSKKEVKINKNNLFEIETTPKLINVIFPMIPGQACGYEGENIYVDSIGDLDNYETEYKGSFNSVIPNVDNNSKYFNYDLCKTRAIDKGLRYFGVNNYDESLTTSQCVVSNNMDDFKQSITSGNIVYDSSPSETSSPSPIVGMYSMSDTDEIYAVIDVRANQLLLTTIYKKNTKIVQQLAMYNTEFNNECYNNGLYNIADIKATWGSNCDGKNGWEITANNATPFIKNTYNFLQQKYNTEIIPNFNYTIGTNGLGEDSTDTAYGCEKDFTLSYMCGNISKTDYRGGESYLQDIPINCQDEFNKCRCVLIITDEGYIYICKKSDVTISDNDRSASLKDNAIIFYTWDFSDKIDKSNQSINYTKNFIDYSIKLEYGDCICSPNKKLAMTCSEYGSLIILTYSDNSVKVGDINYGLDNSSAVYEIKNLPPSNNIGKIAWLNAVGLRKEYPPNLLDKSDEYDVFTGWTSDGNDIYIAQMSPEDGKEWCNNNSYCAGFQYTDGICYFKNKEMYPKGTRQPAYNGSQIYIRKNKIITLDTIYEYEMMPEVDSQGNDFSAQQMSLHDAKKSCDNNSDCAGFQYYNNIAWFKNDNMYPKGQLSTLLGGKLFIKKDYEVIDEADSVGNDIYAGRGMSLHDAKIWCDNNPECAGFTYYIPESIAYFKNDNMYPKGDIQTLLGAKLYIKNNKIDRSKSTCSTKINNIDSLAWEHYIPDIFDGAFMTENYNCSNQLLNPNLGDYTNLNDNKDRLTNELNNLDSSIFEETKNLVNETASLNKENNVLYNSMKENFTPSINQLNDITYLNTLLSNSKKFVISKSYIIITLIVILLGLIIVLYKIKK